MFKKMVTHKNCVSVEEMSHTQEKCHTEKCVTV